MGQATESAARYRKRKEHTAALAKTTRVAKTAKPAGTVKAAGIALGGEE
jgi:hypothetical protein